RIILHEQVAAADKYRTPVRLSRVEVEVVTTGSEYDRTRSSIADRRRLRENSFHPVIRCERPAFDDPDGRKLARNLRINCRGRLVLNDLIDFFVELERVGVDRIEVQTGAIDEFRWRRIAGLVERVKLKMLVKGFDRWARIAFDREATQSTRYIEGPRSGDEVAIGSLSLVVRRQKNIFAAASLIRT